MKYPFSIDTVKMDSHKFVGLFGLVELVGLVGLVASDLHPDDGVDEEEHGDQQNDIRKSLRTLQCCRIVNSLYCM
jgi:hypothetical protein